jgi:hypothetical protein
MLLLLHQGVILQAGVKVSSFARFAVGTVVLLKIYAFWDMTMCHWVSST